MARRRSKGEGSIYWSERKGLWVAKITLPTGERRSKSSKSQKVVREWLHTSQSALRTGLLAGNDSVTVSEFFSNYMKTVAEHTLRPKTLEGYRSVLKINILPIIGKMKLSQLRPDHLQSLYSSRLEKGLSRRTVQLIHLFIHRVLSQAVQWGVLIRNVSDFVEPPSPEKKPMTVWSISEVKQFLEGTKDDRFFVLYVLAIYGGFREVELLGIRREDCRGETVTVNQAVQYKIGTGVVIAHPKN